MYFDSVAAALVMDGHGIYVWSAFGITIIVLTVLAKHPLARKKRLLRDIAGEIRRKSSTENP